MKNGGSVHSFLGPTEVMKFFDSIVKLFISGRGAHGWLVSHWMPWKICGIPWIDNLLDSWWDIYIYMMIYNI